MSGHAPLGVPVVHQCETVLKQNATLVLHVVLAPSYPCSTALSDIQSTGYDLIAINPFSSEVECDLLDEYPGCQHVLLGGSEP